MSGNESGKDSRSDDKPRAKSDAEPTLNDLKDKLRLEDQDIKVLKENHHINGCDVSTMTWEDTKTLMETEEMPLSEMAGRRLVGFILWWEQHCKEHENVEFKNAFGGPKDDHLRAHSRDAHKIANELLHPDAVQTVAAAAKMKNEDIPGTIPSGSVFQDAMGDATSVVTTSEAGGASLS